MKITIALLVALLQVSSLCIAQEPAPLREQQVVEAFVSADEAKWALLKVGLSTAEVKVLLGTPNNIIWRNTGYDDGTRRLVTIYTYAYEMGADIRQLEFDGIGNPEKLVKWTGARKDAN